MPAIKMVVLGDSFVEGRGDPDPGGGYRGWVRRFADLVGLDSGAVANLGTYQATTQVVVDLQLGRALACKPPLVGVVVGVNDLVSDYDENRFRNNLETIFGSLSGMDTTVLTATYPDIPANLPVPEGFRRLLQDRFAQANDVLRDVTQRHRLLCLDIARQPEWMDPALWSEDGLHPSPAGHRHFAESMTDLVTRASGLIAA